MKLLLGLAILAIGCGGGGGGNADGGGADAPLADASTPTPDAFVPPAGYTNLIGRDWGLTAGQLDTYKCARITVAADTYITNIIAQAPPGTHHTVLSISDSSTAGPDGVYDCGVGTLGMVMLYASGPGTSPLDFPADVGLKISAGQQIHLNLHLFNATDNPLAGHSAILIKSQPTPTPTLAEMVFAGKFFFSIPSNNQPYSTTGGCTSNRAFKLFALWPHMHQIATHSKFELVKNGTTQVLHDKPYDFNEQTYYRQSPEIDVAVGDQIRVTCTWVNNTGQNITFGDSSNKEMCFTGMYRYPAVGAGLMECTDNPGF
ncbi:MAG: hypothetical protein M3619_09850 [Myxococcota bacterium]|nr:hypothetical protein [Myxococcota bacterium]